MSAPGVDARTRAEKQAAFGGARAMSSGLKLYLWSGLIFGAVLLGIKHAPALVVGVLCGLIGGIWMTYYLPIDENPVEKKLPTREGMIFLLAWLLVIIVAALGARP
jgi:hypothetical protein